MLARLIFLVLIVAVVVMVIRRLRVRAAAPRKPASINAQTVRCAHCQVYLPNTEAVARGGLYYCSQAHANQVRQRP